jgi:hypothetical protein
MNHLKSLGLVLRVVGVLVGRGLTIAPRSH